MKVHFLCVAIFCTGGCDRESPNKNNAQSPPKSALPDSNLPLPEFYGVYAVQHGGLLQLRPFDTQQQRDDQTPAVEAGAEFIIFDKRISTAALQPTIVRPDHALDNGQPIVIAHRSKPVSGNPEMLRLVPSADLPEETLALVLGKLERGLTAEEVFMFEVGTDESVAKRKSERRRSRALSYLNTIRTSCALYANDNNGSFPPSLESLHLITLTSPYDTSKDAKNSYIYIAGQFNKSDKNNLLTYEKPEIHGGKGTNAVFIGENAKWVSAKELETALKETEARLKH